MLETLAWVNLALLIALAVAFLVFGMRISDRASEKNSEATTIIEFLRSQMSGLDRLLRDEFKAGREEGGGNDRALREEVQRTLVSLGDTIRTSITQLAEIEGQRLDGISRSLQSFIEVNDSRQEALKTTVENRLEGLRAENAEKLEAIRQTVDEKLQGTLEQRLGASFKLVSEQLEAVHRGVGEMQSLAAGVGDLKKILSNVKTRGTWAEVSLENLLEQFLVRDQYQMNVEVRPDSNQRVEFAVRLPADDNGPVWLPIDAKFPVEDYERLVDASETADVAAVDAASRALELRVRTAARDIHDKYICPPYSTDFAIMFLPTEGLFAEVVRRAGLIDSVQREYRVVVAGPTTLAAALTSLRMGFRSLAIQKRSGEVWRVLGAVKTEFGKFEGVLDKVSKKLHEAQSAVDEAGPRRRAMVRKLREVEELPEAEAASLIGLRPAEGAGTEVESEAL